ncbi:MAG TPA: LamG domain-containing protein [Solirubrobacteraceae bacterium]
MGADRPTAYTVPRMGKEAVAILAVVAVLGCVAAPASASDELAHWAFDEGAGQVAADATAHANDGQLGATSGPDADDPAWIAGHDGGRALAFDGSEYVAVADTSLLEPAHVAVDAWVRNAGSPGRWRYVLSKGSLACDRSAYGLYSGWAGGMSFYVSSTTHYTISPEVPRWRIWDGAWHHVVGTYDGQSVRLYVDGAQVGDGTPATFPIAYGIGSKGVYLGIYRGSCSLGFKGAIDDVHVWSDAPPQPGPPLPPIDPEPGTPTQIAIPGGGQASTNPAQNVLSSGARRCLRVSLNRRTVPLHKRVRVVATVRRGKQRMMGVHVLVRGAGVTASGKTNGRGRAGIRLRAHRRGHLTVRVRGQRASCPTQTVRAR